MKLYTIQLSKWRKAESLGIPLLDVTVKSGDKTFAPTWDFLMEYKKDLNENRYIEKFIPLMRLSYKDNKQRWLEVCKMDQIAIACYCRSGKFCHRHILVDMFRKVCESNNIEFEYKGEIE